MSLKQTRRKIRKKMLAVCLFLSISCFAQHTQLTHHDTSSPTSAILQEHQPHRLNPVLTVNTTSPRATVTSFLRYAALAFQYTKMAEKTHTGAEPYAHFQLRKKYRQLANTYLKRATDCLDLSKVDLANEGHLAIEYTILLKEVLDKIPLTVKELPGREKVIKEPNKKEWPITNTKLVIKKVEGGNGMGGYLFSPQTLKKLPKFYAELKTFPYQKNKFATPNFYRFYSKTPGSLVPPDWSIWIPSAMNTPVYDETAWQWIVLIIISGLHVLIFILFSKKYYLSRDKNLSYELWKAISLSAFASSLMLSAMFLSNPINITGAVLQWVDYISFTLAYLFYSASVIYLGLIGSAHFPKPGPKNSIKRYYLSKTAIFAVSTVVATLITTYGLNQIGISLLPILTSLGIIGVGMAFALRATLSHLIGTMIIHVENKFDIGDHISTKDSNGDHSGVVKSIGLRCTTIQDKSGKLIHIPNAILTDHKVTNSPKQEYIKCKLKINLLAMQKKEKIDKAITILNEVLALPNHNKGKKPTRSHPNNMIHDSQYAKPKVHFSSIKEEKLTVTIRYTYASSDWSAFLTFSNDLNHNIIKQFNKENIEFTEPFMVQNED